MKRKGQFNIEYLVALLIFISIIIFLSIQLAQAVPEFHADSVSNRVLAQGYRVTDNLLKTPGQPQRWETSSASAFGFAERPYLINETKLSAFNSGCIGDYTGTKNTLGLDTRSDFRISALLNGTAIIDCGQKRTPLEATQHIIRRTGYTSNGSLVEITFTVWS